MALKRNLNCLKELNVSFFFSFRCLKSFLVIIVISSSCNFIFNYANTTNTAKSKVNCDVACQRGERIYLLKSDVFKRNIEKRTRFFTKLLLFMY